MTEAPTTARVAIPGPVRVRVAVLYADPAIPPRSRVRTRARRSVLAFVLSFLTGTAAFGVVADGMVPTLRDPEYGKKRARLNSRVADHPGRPLVVFLGSSRVAMGVRPPDIEREFDPLHRPVVANVSLVGSGPLLQLLAYDRLRRDGIRPSAVVIEYWPALARDGEADREELRIDTVRLFPADRNLVREFFTRPGDAERELARARVNPWTASRARLLGLTLPSWLPAGLRADAAWAALDGDGWTPGLPDEVVADPDRCFAPCGAYYASRLADTTVSAEGDRAFRALLARCRADGIPAAVVWLPESSRFRGLYSPESERAVTAYWERLLREESVPGWNTRSTVADRFLPDGFHLTRAGATAYAPVLAAEMRHTFPDLGGDE